MAIIAGPRHSTLFSSPPELYLRAGNRCFPFVDDDSVNRVPLCRLCLGHERAERQQREQEQASR
jgi:hypothetical protein